MIFAKTKSYLNSIRINSWLIKVLICIAITLIATIRSIIHLCLGRRIAIIIGPANSNHFINSLLYINDIIKDDYAIYIINSSTFSKKLLKLNFPVFEIGQLFSKINLEVASYNLYVNATQLQYRLYSVILYIIVKILRPRKIWIHELQTSFYPMCSHIDKIKSSDNSICVSIWGNDLYLFSDIAIHRIKIKKILSYVNYLHCESNRDTKLAASLGYAGIFLNTSSITFRAPVEFCISDEVEKDIFLLVKGEYFLRSDNNILYHSIMRNTTFWNNKKIVIFNASKNDYFKSSKLNSIEGINIECVPGTSSSDIMDMMRRSHFHLTCTLSDGVPNTAFEATSVGCIPIINLHSGLVEYLDDYLLHNISYNNFNEADLSLVINNLIHLTEDDRKKLTSKLYQIFIEYIYNENIYSKIVKDFFYD